MSDCRVMFIIVDWLYVWCGELLCTIFPWRFDDSYVYLGESGPYRMPATNPHYVVLCKFLRNFLTVGESSAPSIGWSFSKWKEADTRVHVTVKAFVKTRYEGITKYITIGIKSYGKDAVFWTTWSMSGNSWKVLWKCVPTSVRHMLHAALRNVQRTLRANLRRNCATSSTERFVNIMHDGGVALIRDVVMSRWCIVLWQWKRRDALNTMDPFHRGSFFCDAWRDSPIARPNWVLRRVIRVSNTKLHINILDLVD
jgi:hypothetical protein